LHNDERVMPGLHWYDRSVPALRGRFGVLACALGVLNATPIPTTRAALPFGVGERLSYRVHVDGFGAIGRATMTVTPSVSIRGTETYLLRSEIRAGFGPLRGSDVSESWLDPDRMRILRFHERERRLLRTREVRVEVFPDEQRWTAADGTSGASLTDTPLDELSFIYFLRSLPQEIGKTYSFDRHFDATRNPITVRVMAGDTITTRAGTFPTVVMEMHVLDPRRYRGEGVIRVSLSTDACRIPVRIESSIPTVGSLTMVLDSAERGNP
ncbi:MAG TPA: DUF3108 domain-containing protein, partial [Candidatus Elarobacter sp.]|nr:DUF3108 domain-containing protein [Candidatus Elarobacter sp.]